MQNQILLPFILKIMQMIKHLTDNQKICSTNKWYSNRESIDWAILFYFETRGQKFSRLKVFIPINWMIIFIYIVQSIFD